MDFVGTVPVICPAIPKVLQENLHDAKSHNVAQRRTTSHNVAHQDRDGAWAKHFDFNGWLHDW